MGFFGHDVSQHHNNLPLPGGEPYGPLIMQLVEATKAKEITWLHRFGDDTYSCTHRGHRILFSFLGEPDLSIEVGENRELIIGMYDHELVEALLDAIRYHGKTVEQLDFSDHPELLPDFSGEPAAP